MWVKMGPQPPFPSSSKLLGPKLQNYIVTSHGWERSVRFSHGLRRIIDVSPECKFVPAWYISLYSRFTKNILYRYSPYGCIPIQETINRCQKIREWYSQNLKSGDISILKKKMVRKEFKYKKCQNHIIL